MIREMRSHALDEPRFEAGIDYFKVVLQRGGMEIAANREWMGTVTARPLSSVERAVLLEARREQAISVKELHRQLGYDSDEIREALKTLEGDGLIKPLSKDKYEFANNSGRLSRSVSAREAILDVLGESDEPVGMRDIEEKTGKKIATLRAQMARMVDEGIVVPTAPPTDQSRKYMLKR